MLKLTQATELLATAYHVSPAKLNRTRRELGKNGQLPEAFGRCHPEATYDRIAILLLSLTGATPERIGELADLRRFDEKPGDRSDKITLLDVLSYTIKGLEEKPFEALDMFLSATLSGNPFVMLSSGRKTMMEFGEIPSHEEFIQTTAQVSMMPLRLYCDLAQSVTPPFKVAR
jgi:hypothetical protein